MPLSGDRSLYAPVRHTSVRTGPLQSSAPGHSLAGSVPPSVDEALRSSSKSLDPVSLGSMGARFGRDFSNVRVHTGEKAAKSARDVNARAYTVGRDIVFGEGEHRPESIQGRRLMAHELAHTAQQDSAAHSGWARTSGSQISQPGDSSEKEADRIARPEAAGWPGRDATGQDIVKSKSPLMIQRDKAKPGEAASTKVAAKEIVPFPEKSRVVISRAISDEMLKMIKGFASDSPEAATGFNALNAIEGKVATVKTSNDDLLELVIPSLSLPPEGDSPARTLSNLTLSLERQEDGTFDLQLIAEEEGRTRRLYVYGGIEAKRSTGGKVILSPGGHIPAEATISRGKGSDELRLGAIVDIPVFGKKEIEALKLTRLPDVPPGTADEKKAVEKITAKSAEERKERTKQVALGAGVQFSPKASPVLSASWRINMTPVAKLGSLAQVPLRVQVDYAPSESILASVTSGASSSLSSIKVPVNVRIDLGLGGGALQETSAAGGKQMLPAFGPTVGGAIGFERGRFRTEIEYQHLFNLVGSGKDVNTVVLGAGLTF
jgi:hypothetical protein